MKIDINNPGVNTVKKYQDKWFRVKDFLEHASTFEKIRLLSHTASEHLGFHIGVLDFRGLTSDLQEFVYEVYSVEELREFVLKGEEFANSNHRSPNGQEEKLNYYIYNCLFPRTIEIEECRLIPFLPTKKDNWSIFGYKHDNMVCIKAIIPRCIVKNSAVFCEYDNLEEEAATDDKT